MGFCPLTMQLCLNFQFSRKLLTNTPSLARVLPQYMKGSGWYNVASPQCGPETELMQVVLWWPKTFSISSNSAWHWASLPSWRIPWEMKLSQETRDSSRLKLGSSELCAVSSPWWPWRVGFHAYWRVWTESSGSGQAGWPQGGSPWFNTFLSTVPGGWLQLSPAKLWGAQN